MSQDTRTDGLAVVYKLMLQALAAEIRWAMPDQKLPGLCTAVATLAALADRVPAKRAMDLFEPSVVYIVGVISTEWTPARLDYYDGALDGLHDAFCAELGADVKHLFRDLL